MSIDQIAGLLHLLQLHAYFIYIFLLIYWCISGLYDFGSWIGGISYMDTLFHQGCSNVSVSSVNSLSSVHLFDHWPLALNSNELTGYLSVSVLGSNP